MTGVPESGGGLGDNPFRSFWMGGFEGADHHNPDGTALDMVRAHGHLDHLEGDYARVARLGLSTVRESLGWRLCEPAPGVFDFERPLRMARAARRHGLQILWSLMHYGTPADISLLDDALIERLALFAAQAARVLGPESDAVPVYTPVNEINFLAWAAAHTNLIGGYVGDPASTGESSRHSGYAIKRRLVRATLAAMQAVRRVDPRARFMQVEPLVHVVAPVDQPELAVLAREVAGFQWQTWDLLAGMSEPGLGGSPAMLDLLGVNHYHSGQWEVGTECRLEWHERDPRRRGFDALLQDAWRRYGRPMVVSETSHIGAGRALWLSDMASQVARARGAGVPVWGMCLYPVVDRPDWNEPTRWHHSGLWDVATHETPPPGTAAAPGQAMARLLHRPYAQALAQWQRRLPEPSELAHRRSAKPCLIVFSRRRWGLAQHRTQQLMTRLADHFQIVFVEEPVPAPPNEAASLVLTCPQPDVQVLRACLPPLDAGCHGGAGPGFDGVQVPLLRSLLLRFLAEHGHAPGEAIAWLGTPTALPLAASLHCRLKVHDAAQPTQDELRAAPKWHSRERALLRSADLVLARGDQAHARLRRERAQAVCLRDGVDAAHFAASRLAAGGSEAQEARRLLGALQGPRLGYFGRIDERIDLALLAAIADLRPAWQIVMVGPVQGLASADLPRRANLHWLGEQPYALLPYLLDRWQVGLLPLADGASSRLAQPPQLLEYLAGGRPVVATPLPEVPAALAGRLLVAQDAKGFVAACEAALAAIAPEPSVAAAPAQWSWDDAARMALLLLEGARARTAPGPATVTLGEEAAGHPDANPSWGRAGS